MKLKGIKENGGMVLPISLVLMGCAAIALGALVSLSQHELRMTERTLVWKAALPLAEAGIEDALAHLNSGLSLTNNGWTFEPARDVYCKQRQLSTGFYQVEISKTSPPEIRSTGFTSLPLSTNHLSRSVLVRTKTIPQAGIRVVDKVTGGSDGMLDSFDSSKTEFSTAGQYVPSKRKDQCLVATISGNHDKVDLGNRRLYGFAGTGGGTVKVGSKGSVGSFAWFERANIYGKIEPGHFFSDFTMAFTNVEPPFRVGLTPIGAKIGTNNYSYVFAGADYVVDKFRLTGKQQAIVLGKTRVLAKNDFSITAGAAVVIAPGASLTLYADGPVTITGRGFVNLQGRARFFQLYGTTNCDAITLIGSADYIGRIYAPEAEVKLSGTSSYVGHIDAHEVDLGGNTAFHADEDGAPVTYHVVSWREI